MRPPSSGLPAWTVGKKLRCYLTYTGIYEWQISNHTGLDEKTIIGIENGEELTVTQLTLLADYFNVSPGFLLDEDFSPFGLDFAQGWMQSQAKVDLGYDR